MQLFLRELQRPCAVVNLDFANDGVPYDTAIDVRDLITLEVRKVSLRLHY